jgi:hypothetical protein
VKIVRCKCGAERAVAGELAGRPVLSLLFVILDVAELTGSGWSRHGGRWRCVYCTRRANLFRGMAGGGSTRKTTPPAVPCNVTDPPPPTGNEM